VTKNSGSVSRSDERAVASGGVPEHTSVSDTDLIQLQPMFRMFARHWLLAIVTMVLVAGVVFGLSFLMTKRYEASATVMPVSQEGPGSLLRTLASQVGGLAALAGVDASGGSMTASQAVALLQSRELIQRFVTDQNLLPVLFSGQWDSSKGDWKHSITRRPPSLEDAYRLITRRVLSVEEDRRTGLVIIRVTWTDPELAAKWANELLRRANEKARELALRDADQSLVHLKREMDRATAVEVRQSIAALMEAQLNKKVLAEVRPDFAFRVLDTALPSDLDNFVSPSRKIYLGAGLGLGLVAALLLVLFMDTRRRQ
jgi:uncharacterized protein involved in exopolysaccharide biosynthesis